MVRAEGHRRAHLQTAMAWSRSWPPSSAFQGCSLQSWSRQSFERRLVVLVGPSCGLVLVPLRQIGGVVREGDRAVRLSTQNTPLDLHLGGRYAGGSLMILGSGRRNAR